MKTTLILDEKAEERKHYSIAEKIRFCEFALVKMEQDLASLNSVANEVGISSSCLSRWLNRLPQYRFVARQDQVRYILHRGRKNQLDCIGAELLAFVENLRESGYSISRKMLVAQATNILGSDSSFSSKTYAARPQSVSRWMRKNNLTIRSGTHQAQAPPQTVTTSAANFFVNVAWPAVSLDQPHRHKDFIINMDETPVFFSMHPTKSVDKIGTKTINICIAKYAGQRATVAVCFTASGVQLKSMIIFKGERSFSFCY
jgi:hypothetical protein